MISKRLFDILSSLVGLVLLLPLFFIVSLLIKLDSHGPIFFRQIRVGKNGVTFRIFKFRTMSADAETRGLQVTTSADQRITRIGGILRKYKIDELPQLINVLTGEMSLVGPRPEVPQYVAHYPSETKEIVLSVSPGITDNASIQFRNENELLEGKSDPEKYYIETILPKKLDMYVDYVQNRTFLNDIKLIFKTLLGIHQ